VSARLFERDDAMALLAAALEQVQSARHGQIVVVRGEAGIGKTSLVRAFAANSPLPVVLAGCDNLRTPRPFGPMLDIAAARGESLAALAVPGVSREAVFAAALGLLGDPLVLVIEDVHGPMRRRWICSRFWAGGSRTCPPWWC
jgi:hypothetical protein